MKTTANRKQKSEMGFGMNDKDINKSKNAQTINKIIIIKDKEKKKRAKAVSREIIKVAYPSIQVIKKARDRPSVDLFL